MPTSPKPITIVRVYLAGQLIDEVTLPGRVASTGSKRSTKQQGSK